MARCGGCGGGRSGGGVASTTIASAAWEDGWGEERRRRLEEERDKYYMRFQWQMASYICFREVNIQRMANMSRSDEDRYTSPILGHENFSEIGKIFRYESISRSHARH